MYLYILTSLYEMELKLNMATHPTLNSCLAEFWKLEFVVCTEFTILRSAGNLSNSLEKTLQSPHGFFLDSPLDLHKQRDLKRQVFSSATNPLTPRLCPALFFWRPGTTRCLWWVSTACLRHMVCWRPGTIQPKIHVSVLLLLQHWTACLYRLSDQKGSPERPCLIVSAQSWWYLQW